MDMTCKPKNINELCHVERAVSDKTYKAGTCFVKLSAVDEFVGQLQHPDIIDSRYAALEPKDDTLNNKYLFLAINRKFSEFLRRYRTTINLQVDTLQHFIIDWHDDTQAQRYIVQHINMINDEMTHTERQIEIEKEIKRYYLKKMMC